MRVVSMSDVRPVREDSWLVKFASFDRSLLYAGTEEKGNSHCEFHIRIRETDCCSASHDS